MVPNERATRSAERENLPSASDPFVSLGFGHAEIFRAVEFLFRGPLNIQRASSDEKIFRQSKQKTARIVDPIRRFFVTNDGKDSADSMCNEFLEAPVRRYTP